MYQYISDPALLQFITGEIRTVAIVKLLPLGNLCLFREQNDL